MAESSPSRASILLRKIAAATGLYLLWPAADLVHAGSYGRGGAFALSMGAIYASGTLVLAWTAIAGPSTAKPGLVRFVLGSGIVAGVGYGGLRLGMALFPESNLLGGLGLIFGPINWLGALGLLIGVIMVIAERIWYWCRRPVGR